MTTIVIAAHNEEAVIGDCLDGLLRDARPGELEIVVAANGCTDATAEVARQRAGVTVLDLPAPGKSPALNAGDAAATGFPRIYLDADIMVDADSVRRIAEAFTAAGSHQPLAVVPNRKMMTDDSSWPVRCFYAINTRLPVYESALFGRGLIALSEEAHSRFDRFPDVVADDLFLDSLFSPSERLLLPTVTTAVEAPRRTRDLLHRLERVRAGNRGLRGAAGCTGVRASRRWDWLTHVVLRDPRLVPAGAVYFLITLAAEVRARRRGATVLAWQRTHDGRLPPR